MSSTDVRYPAASNPGSSSPPVITPSYASQLPDPPGAYDSVRYSRCATGPRFLTTIHGILNIIIIVALVCVLISAGVANRQNTRDADNSSYTSKAKVSAFHTRNAVLVFASFGLIFILLDTILHVTSLVNRLPNIFHKIFIIVMIVMGVIYFILACCSAAWEQKMRDTVEKEGIYQRKGAAASASFFLFVAMIAQLTNFIIRLIIKPSQNFTP